MWIFSQEGFFSIVHKQDGFHVRARRQRDFINLSLIPVKSYPGSDYPWRAILEEKTELLKLFAKLGTSVDYPNFKGRIGQRPDQKDRLGNYHKIWALMAKEEEA